MQTLHFLTIILFILTIIVVLTYKIYKFIKKINKLYNYFIISENDKKLSLISKEIPPINGDFPTQEELNNL